MIDRYYMVCAGNDEHGAMYGPYKTAEEAESQAQRLGLDWVMVVGKDEYGTTLTKRFYQPGLPAVAHDMKVAVVKPLSDDESKFFEEYEKQMAPSNCAECGFQIDPADLYTVPLEHLDGTTEVVSFHADFAKGCVLKWSGKRLDEAGAKLRKILEMFK